jgi:Leucine-rich repeat (LRR) protein
MAGWFKGLNKLSLLDLGKNEIKTIDSKVFEDLINLKFLEINENGLESISLLENLKSVIKLSANQNNISKLNFDGLPELNNLHILELARNKITELNDENFKTS